METIEITQEMDDCDKAALTKLCEFFGMTKEQIENEMFYFTNGEGWNYSGFTIGSTETGTGLVVGDFVVKKDGEFYKIPNRLTFLLEEIKDGGKASFFSGLAVSLQSVALWDEPTLAGEIIGGLGSEVSEFAKYMKEEGGVDAETLEWLVDTGVVKVGE